VSDRLAVANAIEDAGIPRERRYLARIEELTMPDFKKTVTAARKKIEEAEFKLFVARADAVHTILRGASAMDIMMVCAEALSEVAPDCCEGHRAAFEEDLRGMIDDCLAQQQDAEAAPDADGDAPPPHVH
jgi:hypothetical protein